MSTTCTPLESRSVHFTVDLKAVVHLARRLVLEENWRASISMLKEATIPPLPLDDIVDILSGKSTLVGNEKGFEIAPQDPQDKDFLWYQSTAAWQKAGYVEFDGQYYQAYGVIEGYDTYGLDEFIKTIEEREGFMSYKQFATRRSLPYMEDSHTDIVRFDVAKQPVLFKRVQGPAFWVETFTDFKKGLEAFNKHRTLQSFGSSDGRVVQVSQCEFFLKALVKGILSGYVDPEIPFSDFDRDCLEEITLLRSDFELAECDLDTDNLQFDNRGYQINASYLFDQFQDDAYRALYRMRIEEQAHRSGGFFQLPVRDSREDPIEYLTVPLAPFLHWASRQEFGRQKGTIPAWKCVTPSGMKMIGDSSMHTDWWIGCGMNENAAYDQDHPVNKAAWRYAFSLARVKGQNCIKLAGKGKVTGTVVFPKPNEGVPAGSIAVVPFAGVDYEIALLSACKSDAGAVISQVGGKLAHLAIVSREMNGRLVVMDEAMTLMQAGQLVTVDLENSQVTIHKMNHLVDDDDD